MQYFLHFRQGYAVGGMLVRFRRWIQPLLWLIVIVFLTAGGVWAYDHFDVARWQTLDPQKLTGVAQKGAIYDRDGSYVTTLVGRENRTVIDTSALPRHVIDAFLAAEDLRFYKHPGFDVTRILGAVASNVRAGGFSQGASTITQQLVKLSHLSSQKTIARKLEEIWLALQMEEMYTKDQILDMYLNFIYFGQGAYGIQAAAEVTFGVDAAELSPAQSAALAAAIKAPSAYSLHASPEANRERRLYILSVMRDEGMLTPEQYEAAAKEDVTVVASGAVQTEYGWFVDAVLDEAELQLDVSAEVLLAGGYRIETTLDPQMQTIMDQQFASSSAFPANARDGTPVQAAAAAVDTASGAVRAIVGGREYQTRRGLNRATHLRRQPGSALKPLAVYAPAMEYAGLTCADVILDEPTAFGTYKPQNAGNAYYGNVTVRTALKNSLNIPAVKLIEQIGLASSRRYLQAVGIEVTDSDWNLSLALGSMTYGASPVQMAAAYAPFANGGIYYAPYFIERITDQSGVVVYQHQDAGTRVLSEQSAYLMTNLMQTVVATGTGTRLNSAGVSVAGKTGTVNMTGGGNRDAWMSAYTAELSTAVWMGYDQPDNTHRLPNSVSGGTNPATLARNFLKAYYASRSKPAFRKPSGIVSVTLDKKAIQLKGEPMLASSLTPDAYKLTEVFREGTQPTKKSDVWTAPASAKSFYVTHDEQGQPRLVIQASGAAVYRVQRDAVGESFILTEMRAEAGQTLTYTDDRAQPGVTYTYRVIPVHAELLDNGILLEGMQSVQIARVERPSFGSWFSSLFDRDDDEDNRPVSIFAAPSVTPAIP
ncbi:MAG: PBP1A family penicillin-binding protein [Clostridiales bacterium]|nr:PBP1A family penicillin-binding protein [Clostridiales bacterium]